jgi:endonuclease G
MSPPQRGLLFLLIVFLIFLVVSLEYQSNSAREPGQETVTGNRNLRFGMPAPATTDPRNHQAFLIERPEYVLSYNDLTHTSNWANWCLEHSDLGKANRGPFSPDPLLPRGFDHITSHDYEGSGFDRGHLCPAQDRSASQEAMDATFFMTNVMPQSPKSNQEAWERLESYCRTLTRHEEVIYLTCGPAGTGGTGKEGLREHIGKGRVQINVPAHLWKVALVLPHAGAEPTRQTRVIAVIMPNDQSVGYDWTRYRVSVAAVEQLTGFRFFPNLPLDLARDLKVKVDDVKVHVAHP